jgi:Bifunctional DNA primase/polymerase, N-terminal/Primase C terminal 2 (PriCT-2)
MTDPTDQSAGAGIPFMLTKKTKAVLRARGYLDADITRMTPADAHKIIGNGAGAAPDALTAALGYAKRGWAIFPVPPGTRKSQKSAKSSSRRLWGMTSDPVEIESDFRQWPDAGVGIPTGEVNSFFVVEADTLEGHNVDGLASLKALEAEHGQLPETLMVESPTGSVHRYFNWPKTPGMDIRNSGSKLGPGIDVKGNGGMVIAPPTKTKKGVYRWVNDLPIADAPDWLIKLVEKSERPQRVPNAAPNAKYELIEDDKLREVMTCVPNDEDTDWDSWNRVGLALYAATNGSSFGLELFDEWSARSGKYDAANTEDKWSKFETSPPNNISVRTLFFLANAAQFKAEMAALTALQASSEWEWTPVEQAFPNDLEDDDDDNDDDDALLARRAPTIDPRAFYGPLARIVEETTRHSEATKVGVAAQILVRVSNTLRPFYNDLGDHRIPLNLFLIQTGLSAKGRKGTSAIIADQHFEPIIQKIAREIQARLAFTDVDAMAYAEAEAAVAESLRKLEWTRNVQPTFESEREVELAALQAEHQATAQGIDAHKAHLRAKVRAPRTVREYEKQIAELEAKQINIGEFVAATEAELAAIRQVLKDLAAALEKAEAEHSVAGVRLATLPSPTSAPVEPWLKLFASLSEGPVTVPSVSSGEGLVYAIRDPGFAQGPRGRVPDPGVDNKCLMIDQDEFGATLAAIMRSGSTLSATMRTLWDCRPVGSATKTSPTYCKEPYTTLSASITPSELMGRMFDKHDTSSSADNGFGNRPLYLWVKRDKYVSHPKATPDLTEMMEEVARNILHVYEVLKPKGAFLSTPIGWSREAYDLYDREYRRIDKLQDGASANAGKLLVRLAVYTRKIATILSVVNGEYEISIGALEAAISWVEYAAGTINAIAASAVERQKAKTLSDDGEKVLAALKALGGDTKPIPSRDVRRKAQLESKPFDVAVAALLQHAPSPIVMSAESWASGRRTTRQRAMLTFATGTVVDAEPEDAPF